jgi:hypothetical protein
MDAWPHLLSPVQSSAAQIRADLSALDEKETPVWNMYAKFRNGSCILGRVSMEAGSEISTTGRSGWASYPKLAGNAGMPLKKPVLFSQHPCLRLI